MHRHYSTAAGVQQITDKQAPKSKERGINRGSSQNDAHIRAHVGQTGNV
jgi:hypothetical protein